MKLCTHILFSVLALGTMPLLAETPISEDNYSAAQDMLPFSKSCSYTSSAPVNIQLPGFSLMADSGSLKHSLDIVVTKKPYKSAPLFTSNMENVSWMGDGMRLLPNGEHFSDSIPALISLAYDPDRIPRGYKPKDIYTYYCDDSHSWHRLERVSVDTIQHIITSFTTHFTDFANAVIKVPEMPESKAFVPTQMTELPDVNPLQGIPMIEVPTPNNRGTAELTYPIELPKGRQGMQPNVDLHYSSAGGNGILGIGWSLTSPAVTIDTRWGVPRYDPNYETEQYMVNGAPVLLRDADGTAKPLPYQDTVYQLRSNYSGRVRFYARDTKNADRIVRYGSNPTNYYWVVTDRNGITTYYGRTFNPSNPTDRTLDESSIVRTADSCIAYWAATASVDVYGNYIKYYNGKSGNIVYVEYIEYTGNINQNIKPIYRIHLGYTGRNDKSTNGRLGVLQEEQNLLCHMLIQYHNPNKSDNYIYNLAAYYFQYTEPKETTLYKTRLAEVVMLDSVPDLMLEKICDLEDIVTGSPTVLRNRAFQEVLDEAEMNNNLELYEQLYLQWQQEEGHAYGVNSIPANVTSFSYNDAPTSSNIFQSVHQITGSGGKELSKSQSTSWSVGGTATVGAGANIAMTTLSGGGNYDFSRSTGEIKTMLLDLNGDGLTDIVYEDNNSVYYKRQYKNANSYGFANPIPISGLHRLSREITNTHTWGLQLSLGANISYSNPISTTYTDAYFSDVNADGLPDMIDGDSILINQLVNGVPTFGVFTGIQSQQITVNNSHCDKTIILDGEADRHIECDLEEILVDSYPLDDNYGQEYGFEVVNDENESYPQLQYVDGNVVWVQNQEDILSEIEWTTAEIPSLPTPRQAIRNIRDRELNIDNSLIYRIENGRVNVYRLEYVCTPFKPDPEIETVRVWVAPHGGTIMLTDSIMLLEDTSETRIHSLTADGVEYRIQLCDSVWVLPSDTMRLHALNYSLLKQGSIAADDYTPHRWNSSISVKKGDVLMFRLMSGNNNRFDKTKWRHIIQYSDETQVYDSENDFICTGDGYFRAHSSGAISLSLKGANESPTPVRLKVIKNHQTSPCLKDTVLQQGAMQIPLIQTSVQTEDSIFIRLEPQYTNSPEPRWSDIHLFPELKFLSTGLTDTVKYYPDIQIQYSALSVSSPYGKLFGPLHKGWGAFAHQDIHHQNIIILDSLVNTQDLAGNYVEQQGDSFENYVPDTTNLANANESGMVSQINNAFMDAGVFNPTAKSNYWIPMRADSRTELWIAYGNLGCVGKIVHSNAREITLPDTVQDIVEYDSSIPFELGETRPNNFVRKQTRSVQNSISWGALIPINASLSFGTYETVVDYMDMNGDGYPDFVGKGGIQYSNPWGGIGRLQIANHYEPFKSINTAGGLSFSACPAELKKIAGNNIKDGKFSMNASFGGAGNAGSSSTIISYVDVNADGLPDKVDVEKDSVWYNLGYKFSEPHIFNGSINEGHNISTSLNASVPFSVGQVSISGGIGESLSTDKTEQILADINGDGLPDKVLLYGNTVKVAYHRGIEHDSIIFDSEKTLSNLSCINKNETNNTSTTLSVTGGFTFLGIVKFNIGVQASPFGISISEGKVMLTDMNGDGLTDYVWTNGNQMLVRYNKTEQANLLKAVTNPTGQNILLNYALSAPTTEHRSRQWELVRIEDFAHHHPMQEAMSNITTITYDSAYYDNYEKTDYGYAHVRTIANNEKVKDEYYYRSLLQNGEICEDILSDMNGSRIIRHINGDIYRNVNPMGTPDICEDANVRIYQEGYRTEYYEREGAPQITTSYNIIYDDYHNMVRYRDEGDIAISDDDWTQEIDYLPTEANNMVSLPKEERVSGLSLLRKSRINYNPYGKPAHIHFIDTDNGDDATTHLQYDTLGNINKIIMPKDVNGEYNWTSFEYDTIAYSLITSMDNPYRTRTYTRYNYPWGVPIRVIDPAEDTIKYIYDYKGRLERVLAPTELQHKRDYTVKYTYNLINHNLKTQPLFDVTHLYKDMYDSLFVQKEVAIYDERGRIMQKKHYAELNGLDKWIVDGAEEWDAFGRTIVQEYPFESQTTYPWAYESLNHNQAWEQTTYDVLDRPIQIMHDDGLYKDYYYHFRPDLNGITRLLTETIDENGVHTAVLKSPQDWLIQQTAGDGSETFFEYTPIGELQQITDAEGYNTVYKYDMFGRMVLRSHPDAGETLMKYDLTGNLINKYTANLTAYSSEIMYDYSYGRLMRIRYPHNIENDVIYQYDQAGRIARRIDGAGQEEFIYDHMGNVAQSTRRIIVPTETNAYTFKTQYKYDSFGRMRNIIYPDGEVVFYMYTTGGLLKAVTGTKQGYDAVYLWDRKYDEQGRKTYQLYGNGVQSQYSYDQNRQWLNQLHSESLPYGVVMQELTYSYDSVGNIVYIGQFAPDLPDYFSTVIPTPSLGGEYENIYRYDRQYRLSYSEGAGKYPYIFEANYSPSGRMGIKKNYTTPWTTDLLYGYDKSYMTHQPRTIYDSETGEGIELFWDANGNLAQIINCKQGTKRYHEWDEENRLKFVLGEKYAGFYGYDANGERVYKLTGMSSEYAINLGSSYAQVVFDDAVLYPNPYIVISAESYTKHYYAGAERLASVLGNGGFDVMTTCMDHQFDSHDNLLLDVFDNHYQFDYSDPFRYEHTISEPVGTTSIDDQTYEELKYLCSPVELDYVEVLAVQDILYDAIDKYEISSGSQEEERYFYHSDHLGSANWITDADGVPVQYIHYAPYGELIDNQMATSYDERYKFTGKERDAESGYDFFGARFLWSAIGHWLSVDPLAGDYPWISPYAYSLWNPIKYIDPDGKKIIIAPNGLFEKIAQKLGFSIGYVKQVKNDLELLKRDNPTVRDMIINLENSENDHIISFPDKKWNTAQPASQKDFEDHKSQGSFVKYDPNNWETKNGDVRNPRAGLGHELKHSSDIDKGKGNSEKINGIPIMEIDAINMENKVRQQTGDSKRTTYGGKEIPSNLLD